MKSLENFLEKGMIFQGSHWQLQKSANGYERSTGSDLSTQVSAGRRFKLIEQIPIEFGQVASQARRTKVRLLEDGYMYGIKFLYKLPNGLYKEQPNTFKFRVE